VLGMPLVPTTPVPRCPRSPWRRVKFSLSSAAGTDWAKHGHTALRSIPGGSVPSSPRYVSVHERNWQCRVVPTEDGVQDVE
jgi:hypothetical protein